MAATNQTYLPTYEELYVPTLNLTSAALKAGAVHFGVYCDIPSKVRKFYFYILWVIFGKFDIIWQIFTTRGLLCLNRF
jgi:hypothetical protein